jgi:hypothetical protein
VFGPIAGAVVAAVVYKLFSGSGLAEFVRIPTG